MSLTNEQLELRKKGIGASEIAAIAGINPWMSAHDVWCIKRGLAESVENVKSRMGHRVEAAVCAEYCEDQGVEVEEVGTIVHPQRDWQLATPDRRVKGHRRLLEVKCVGWRMAHHWGTEVDAIPEYYRPQVEQQLEVCDLDECHVAAWIGGSDFRIYTIRRDRELARILTEIGERFWVDNVLGGVPPKVDGTEGARRMLEKLFPRNAKPLLKATPDVEGIGLELLDARKTLERIERRKTELENRIIEAVGDADGIVADDWRVTYRANKNNKRVFRFVSKEEAAA
jgi:putative phage-type endonuclease